MNIVKDIFKKRELIIIAAIVAVAAVCAILLTPKHTGRTAIVEYNGVVVAEIDLGRDKVYRVDGDLPATFEVKNGRIRFINSVCPDHLCENYFGWIEKETDYAICLPARLTVRIKAA